MNSKQREALEAVYECAKDGVLKIRESAFEKVLEALKEPTHNCEVGTAKEQYKRFDKICSGKHTTEDCPLFEKTSPCCSPLCFARWSQMPYEGEVKNEQ